MGFKEDLMKQYRQWKEDPTPFFRGEVIIFKILEENERLKLLFDILLTLFLKEKEMEGPK